MSYRYAKQRAARVQVRDDAAVLLDRLLIRFSAPDGEKVAALSDREARMIAEMIQRLRPPVGVKAPIVLTGFTRRKR